MSKLKDIPFGSEIPTFDNSGYITLSSGLKDSSGNTIITMASGSAFFDGLACYAGGTSYACYASCASCACEACCAGLAGDAFYLIYCDLHLQPSYCASFSAYLLV